MLVLDTNHLDIILEPNTHRDQLVQRLKESEREVYTTVITVEEKFKG